MVQEPQWTLGKWPQSKNEEQICKKDKRELSSALTGSCQSDNNCVSLKPFVDVMGGEKI